MQALARGTVGVMAGLHAEQVVFTSLADVVSHRRTLDFSLLELVKTLAT